MIFSDYFKKIGKVCQAQSSQHSADYQAGAMAMMAQIETALTTTTLYNLGLQLTETQLELELISSKYLSLQGHCKRLEAEAARRSKAKIGRSSFATKILLVIANKNSKAPAEQIGQIKELAQDAARADDNLFPS